MDFLGVDGAVRRPNLAVLSLSAAEAVVCLNLEDLAL